MGSYQNIRLARTAICNLILGMQLLLFMYILRLLLNAFFMCLYKCIVGSPPSKVYGSMRTIASRASERF